MSTLGGFFAALAHKWQIMPQEGKAEGGMEGGLTFGEIMINRLCPQNYSPSSASASLEMCSRTAHRTLVLAQSSLSNGGNYEPNARTYVPQALARVRRNGDTQIG